MNRTGLARQALSRIHFEMEAARTKLCEQVQREVHGLTPHMNDMFDGELPTGIVSGRRIHLFPLGDFRDVRVGPLSGQSTLYLGGNGRLYEYGPVDTVSDTPVDRLQKHQLVIRLQLVDVTRLAYYELMIVRDLIRQIGI